MKRSKSMIAGIACALGCMVCVGLYMGQVDAEAQAYRREAMERYGGEQTEVCVASRDIAAGETIGDSAVETRTWLAALLPEGAVASPAEVVGRQAGSSILEGEVVTAKRLEASQAALQVPDGLVAVSVPAREVQAIGGALAPGMRADVYAIGATSTSKLLSEALIVATSASSAELSGPSAISWVTLAVSPSAVEELIAAAEGMELYFVLPNTAVDAEALAEGAGAARGAGGAAGEAPGAGSAGSSGGDGAGSRSARDEALEAALRPQGKDGAAAGPASQEGAV